MVLSHTLSPFGGKENIVFYTLAAGRCPAAFWLPGRAGRGKIYIHSAAWAVGFGGCAD